MVLRLWNRARRKAMKLSQEQVASMLGVTDATVSRYELDYEDTPDWIDNEVTNKLNELELFYKRRYEEIDMAYLYTSLKMMFLFIYQDELIQFDLYNEEERKYISSEIRKCVDEL